MVAGGVGFPVVGGVAAVGTGREEAAGAGEEGAGVEEEAILWEAAVVGVGEAVVGAGEGGVARAETGLCHDLVERGVAPHGEGQEAGEGGRPEEGKEVLM